MKNFNRLLLLAALIILAVKVFSSDFDKLKTEKTTTIAMVKE
ncbi:hypothetical protein [Lacinutrix mariniflava]|nr:hypothetical protein [Lacinutrix mariniflava]